MKFFRKLSLEEQITKIKAEAKHREISCPSANIAYFAVAVDLDHTEAAEHFLSENLKEKIRTMLGVEE